MTNQIIHGDCFEILKSFPDNYFDAIITDPPYLTTNLKFDQTRFDWIELWKLLKLKTKKEGLFIIFASFKSSLDLINSNKKNFRYNLVWKKTMPTGFLDANYRPLRSHELILIFAKQLRKSIYNPQDTTGQKYSRIRDKEGKASHYGNHIRTNTKQKDTRCPTDVLTFKNSNSKSLHPTQKPLDLITYLINTYSNENQLILDPFAGSGTLAIACLETNRRYVCIEKDDKYFEVMKKRISQWHNNRLNATGTHQLPEEIERINYDENSGQMSLF